jgi:hypothetical protein
MSCLPSPCSPNGVPLGLPALRGRENRRKRADGLNGRRREAAGRIQFLLSESQTWNAGVPKERRWLGTPNAVRLQATDAIVCQLAVLLKRTRWRALNAVRVASGAIMNGLLECDVLFHCTATGQARGFDIRTCPLLELMPPTKQYGMG